ncbi:unnamed protein product [Nesidiocoris tenuis]|uniref:Uncharacterized protein n=1 Tax=Nesidiocoris tenuis TaxID=355587 RepID=A0A6H5HJY2_9HEMI|nr:unnamed protein product [Nesidiocoris tenuis]
MDSTAGGRRKGTGLRDQIRRNRRTPDTEVMHWHSQQIDDKLDPEGSFNQATQGGGLGNRREPESGGSCECKRRLTSGVSGRRHAGLLRHPQVDKQRRSGRGRPRESWRILPNSMGLQLKKYSHQERWQEVSADTTFALCRVFISTRRLQGYSGLYGLPRVIQGPT